MGFNSGFKGLITQLSGVQNVFRETLQFCRRISVFPQAHFLCNEAGKYNFEIFRFQFFFFPTFARNRRWVYFQFKSTITKIYLLKYFILKIKALISNVHNNNSNKSPTRCPRTWLEEAGNTYSFQIGKTFWNSRLADSVAEERIKLAFK